jgi:hypothetical protein
MGASNEIAAIMNYENTTQSQAKVRHMMVIKRDGRTQRVSTISRLWELLAYPLFFPHGTLGWGVHGSSELDNTVNHIRCANTSNYALSCTYSLGTLLSHIQQIDK